MKTVFHNDNYTVNIVDTMIQIVINCRGPLVNFPAHFEEMCTFMLTKVNLIGYTRVFLEAEIYRLYEDDFVNLFNFITSFPSITTLFDRIGAGGKSRYTKASDMYTNNLQELYIDHGSRLRYGNLKELNVSPRLKTLQICKVSVCDRVMLARQIVDGNFPPKLEENPFSKRVVGGNTVLPTLALQIRGYKRLYEVINEIRVMIYFFMKPLVGKDVVLNHITPLLRFEDWDYRKFIRIRSDDANAIVDAYKDVARARKRKRDYDERAVRVAESNLKRVVRQKTRLFGR